MHIGVSSSGKAPVLHTGEGGSTPPIPTILNQKPTIMKQVLLAILMAFTLVTQADVTIKFGNQATATVVDTSKHSNVTVTQPNQSFTFLSSLGLTTLILIGIVFFILMTALVENEQGTAATVVVLGISALLYFLGGKTLFRDFFSFIKESTGTFIAIVVGYIVSGVIYSFIKWYFYVKRQKVKGYGMPIAGDHTTRLIRWISYWPFSIWWTLLDEPIKALVEKLGTSYDGIAKKIYEKA